MTNATTITAQPGQPIIDIERIVDAPVDAVFRAHVEADLIARWLGPKGYEMDVTRFDPTDGGAYEFTHRNPEGEEFAFRGSFHSIVPGERVIRTFEWLGAPGHVSLESVDFEDVDGRTRITSRAVYQSIEDRDAMIEHGMATGVTEGYERLDDLLDA
ncbi:MAG TPA: SRPBCC family protein [Galbitalea sp.]|jgi:uncharacterized protein YndB with AHSA1/START domain